MKSGYLNDCKECRNPMNNDYYKKYPEKSIAATRKWQANNREHSLAYKKEYNAAHREERNTYLMEWVKKYPLKWYIHTLNRKLRKVGKIALEEWTALCEKFNHQCVSCGKKSKLTMDHIVPLSKGGRHEIKNIQPLCKSCNSVKGTKTIDYRTRFLGV